MLDSKHSFPNADRIPQTRHQPDQTELSFCKHCQRVIQLEFLYPALNHPLTSMSELMWGNTLARNGGFQQVHGPVALGGHHVW